MAFRGRPGWLFALEHRLAMLPGSQTIPPYTRAVMSLSLLKFAGQASLVTDCDVLYDRRTNSTADSADPNSLAGRPLSTHTLNRLSFTAASWSVTAGLLSIDC